MKEEDGLLSQPCGTSPSGAVIPEAGGSAAVTPGPWTAESDSTEDNGPWHVFAANDRLVASVEWWDQSDANARLIAAAPDLLEALQTLTDNIEQAWPHLMHLGPLVAARAAIAKATGR